MNVLYSSDENYAKYAMVSICSLLENNLDVDILRIYYIEDGLSESSKTKLRSIAQQFKREIVFIKASGIDISFIRMTSFSPAGYYRLMVSDFIHEDKVLYLDCDTIVLGSLRELWETPIDDKLLAGVKDTVEDFMATSIGLKNNSCYINSGVMLYNLKKMREICFPEKVKDCFKLFCGYVPHHDQGVVNSLANNEILYLPPKYNLMSQYIIFSEKQLRKLFSIEYLYDQEQIDEARENPTIVHFLNKFYGRPWEEKCENPFLTAFNEFAKRNGIHIALVHKKANAKNIRILIRKGLYKILPFYLYCFIERVLYYPRRRKFKSIYKMQK